MKRILLAAAVLLALASCGPKNGQHTIYVVTTGDVHGSYFDEPYVEGQKTKSSLMSVKWYVDSLRAAVGAENVVLLDDGDILQGDNAAYYYNYVATDQPHVYPQMAAYMGYDACVLGNHDIETGHAVYDKVGAELKAAGIPWLAGNAIKPDGNPYFPVYTILNRGGLKIAVLGFDNPNIKAWLSEDLWSGMEFVSLIPLVQEWVDKVIEKEKPQVVIAAVHCGTGLGDGSIYESQGLDLFHSLKGVDIVIAGHDHRPYYEELDGSVFLNGGAHATGVGYAEVSVDVKNHKVQSKSAVGKIVRMDKNKVDTVMRAHFQPQFEAVKAFTLKPVGTLDMPLITRDAYVGMCDYMNLIHTVELNAPEAQISMAAPLTFNGNVEAGDVIFNDMFTIYPYENQLFVVKMTGEEIRKYLEYSYNTWIQTPGAHVLNIREMPDPRTGAAHWSFAARSYNFDSAAGIIYDVDVTKPFGSRVVIKSMADGAAFEEATEYNVAMTSYRASGGGDLLAAGAGIPADQLDSRVVARYPEIREMIYQYISDHGTVTSAMVSDPTVIGAWKFVPEALASRLLQSDMSLLFQ